MRSGKKALWRENWAIAALEEGDPYLGKLVRKAFEHGLAITLVQSPLNRGTKHWESEVYLLELEQTWRIFALDALKQTTFIEQRRWTYAHEAQESLLLGYSPK